MSEFKADYIPINIAVLQLDTTLDGIMMMIEKDELHGKLIDGIWYVEESSLNQYDKSKAINESQGCGICGSTCGNGC